MTKNKNKQKGGDNVLQISELLKYLGAFHENKGDEL